MTVGDQLQVLDRARYVPRLLRQAVSCPLRAWLLIRLLVNHSPLRQCDPLPNQALLDQDGACGAAGPALAPGSALPRPARRTPGHPVDASDQPGSLTKRMGAARSRLPHRRLSRARSPRLEAAPQAAHAIGFASIDPVTARKRHAAMRKMAAEYESAMPGHAQRGLDGVTFAYPDLINHVMVS